jgi:hypothetical protein
MHTKTRLALLLIALCGSLSCLAQASKGNPSLTKTIPPSPNAASLGKFGEVPVSNYTGVPQINIPLYEASSGDISIPISLSYHAGGIRVEEIASWVGLGWSLNGGGVITRTIRGVADDFGTGTGNYKDNIDFLKNTANSTSARYERYNEVRQGRADTEPDIYFFNFGNYSGKFFVGEDGVNFYTIPQQKIMINSIREVVGGPIVRFVITTTDGVKYEFGKSSDNVRDGIEKNGTYSVCHNGNYQLSTELEETITSSWYLVHIISPRGYTITFDYDQNDYSFRTFGNETNYYKHITMSDTDSECDNRFTYCYVRNHIYGKRLRRINFLHGKVEFDTKTTYRADLTQDKALEYIRIYKIGDAAPIKSYGLNYTYFKRPTDPVPTETLNAGFVDLGTEYRLKLLSVTEYAANNSTPKPPFTFEYNESQHLPPRLDMSSGTTFLSESYAQDHWGYYNGAVNNRRGGGTTGLPTLIPTFFADLWGAGAETPYVGAERTANETFAGSYTIKKIVYPTKGWTEFEFESNKVSSDQFPAYYFQASSNKSRRTPNAPWATSSANANASVNGENFTITSDLKNQGVKGAFVKVSLTEIQDSRPSPCPVITETTPATNIAIMVDIYNSSNSIVIQGVQHNSEYFIPNGTYYIKLTRKVGFSCNSYFVSNLSYTEYTLGTSATNVTIGGLRIKTIKDHDGINPLNDKIKSFKYNKFSNTSLSSGYALYFPLYSWGYYSEDYIKCVVSGSGQYNKSLFCAFLVMQSYSNYPLTTTQGGIVGYQNVTVEDGTGGSNGKMEYTYTAPNLYPDEFQAVFPFPSACSFDWKRGLIESETTYKNTAGVFTKVLEKVHTYKRYNSSADPLYINAQGLKIGFKRTSFDNSCAGGTGPVYTFEEKFYNTRTEWLTPESTETKMYDMNDQNKVFVTREEFNYLPSHQQVSLKTTTLSDGTKMIDHFLYPLSYSIAANATGPAQGIKMLQDQHIVTPIIESFTRRVYIPTTNEKVITGSITSFKKNEVNASIVVPDETYSLETADPIQYQGGSTPFYFSSVSSGTVFNKDARYKISSKSFYDNFGNLKEIKQINSTTSNLPVAYQWGHSKTLPVAEVQNAQNNHYTSTNNTTNTSQITIGGVPGVSIQKAITVDYSGTVSLKLSVSGSPAYTTNLSYSGITSGTVTLAKGGCGLTIVNFSNVSPGTYTLTLTLTTPDNGVSGLGACGEVTYPVTTTNVNSIVEFFYESFEEVAATGTATPHTGKKYQLGTYVVPFAKPNARNYIVEYWYLSGTTWIYTTNTYSNGMILSGGTAIDNVRVYPSDARMKSYTYNPVIGISSVIDENGTVLIYEYDSFGRLSYIKNEQGGIEKQYSYNYKN